MEPKFTNRKRNIQEGDDPTFENKKNIQQQREETKADLNRKITTSR